MNLSINHLGENKEGMKFIGDGLKNLPEYLVDLNLILEFNDLGANYENMKFLSDGLKNLPDNLQNFTLDLE